METGHPARPRLIAVLGVASFVACIWYTNNKPVWGFYLLPTRAWELLAGAGLAVVAPRLLKVSASARARGLLGGGRRRRRRRRHVQHQHQVPRVRRAAARARDDRRCGCEWGDGSREPDTAVAGTMPMQWIGKRSYAYYLWHWPALILV